MSACTVCGKAPCYEHRRETVATSPKPPVTTEERAQMRERADKATRVTHAARRRHNGSLIETEAVCGTKLVMPYLGSSFMQGVNCDRCRRILGYCKCCGTTMPHRIDRMCPERDGDLCERVALASDEETVKRVSGCACLLEEGDAGDCPIHHPGESDG